MRLATYNVENLFTRARALNMDTWSEGRQILEAYATMNAMLEEPVYTDAHKARLIELMATLGIDKKNDSRFVELRQNRGQLVKRSVWRGVEIVATGRRDWIGWLELKTEIIDEVATRNTAQVIRDVAADVIGIVEAEGRTALSQFSQSLLPAVGGKPYGQIMLIDGNDDRGIDVGIMATNGHTIGWMRSHVDDLTDRGRRIFSRDCPEFSIWTPSGATIWVLVNHYKSKGYGTKDGSDARRLGQADATRQIYERLKGEGAIHVAIVGDLNDTPDSAPLAPLFTRTDLKDVTTHPSFQADGRPGTFRNGTGKDQIDHILLSPALFEKVTGGGIWRKGVWGGKNGALWEIYPEMTSANHAASDHAAVWCDLDV